MKMTQQRLGPERSKLQYPIRTLLDNGTRVCFGSDWPVSSLIPLYGIEVALTHQFPTNIYGEIDKGLIEKNESVTIPIAKDQPPWLPEQKITLSEAIQCYTKGKYKIYKLN